VAGGSTLLSVHVILLDAASPLRDQARRLAQDGDARLVLVDRGWTRPFEDVQSEDQVLVGTSVPSFFLHHLLHGCVRGRLGDVRVVADTKPLDAAGIGYRWGPWLSGVHLPASEEAPSGPMPAPCERFRKLEDIIAAWGAPPVRFEACPSPFPARLQLQTTSRCVRGCTYCPKARQEIPDRQMERSLFDRLIGECGEHRPPSLELYLHGEPLEDPRIEELATAAKGACPSSLVAVTTHERSVSAERFHRLAGSGLDVVFVSVNVTGSIPVAVLRRRLKRLVEPARTLRAAAKELVVVTLTNLLADGLRGPFRRLCRELGLPLESFRATTRVGDARLRPHVRVHSSDEGCLRPFTTAHVLADGRVVACCEDWRYRRVLGDVGGASLADVWTGEEARRLRRELLDGRPTEPCEHCGILPLRGNPISRGDTPWPTTTT